MNTAILNKQPGKTAFEITKHFAIKAEQSKANFPIDALPEQIQEIVNHYAKYRSYPIDFFATSILTAVGSAIGNSHILRTPNGYTNKANLYVLIVAQPGINKSAPLQAAYEPIFKKQHQAYLSYKEDLKQSRETKETTSPIYLKPILSDATPEYVAGQLANNEKGCTVLVDEIAGFINSFGRYSKGADEQMYLSLWQGSPLIRDTLSRGSLEAESPFLSIIGTIQPGVLDKAFQGKTDNGFFDRWLICYPNFIKKPYPQNQNIDPIIESKFTSLIERLLGLYDLEETKALHYSNEAWEVIYKWICQSTDRENEPNVNDTERGILAKMQIYIHRFALILQMLEYGCSGNCKDRQEIGLNAASSAVKIADYFYTMAEKTRLKSPAELLTGQLKDLYDVLPNDIEFKKANYLEYCNYLAIPERTANDILKNNTGKLWEKLKHGTYLKL